MSLKKVKSRPEGDYRESNGDIWERNIAETGGSKWESRWPIQDTARRLEV